jgi:hypothetical protein
MLSISKRAIAHGYCAEAVAIFGVCAAGARSGPDSRTPARVGGVHPTAYHSAVGWN